MYEKPNKKNVKIRKNKESKKNFSGFLKEKKLKSII